MPPYYYLRERLTQQVVSQDYKTEREAITAMGDSEGLELCVDSGRLHGMAFGFGPKHPPKLGEKRVDPAWRMYYERRLKQLIEVYFEGVTRPPRPE